MHHFRVQSTRMCQSVRQITKWRVIDNTINRDVGRNPPLAKLTHNEARRIAANIAKPELATAPTSTFSASVMPTRDCCENESSGTQCVRADRVQGNSHIIRDVT